MPKEKWRWVPGYEGYYAVSSWGRVYSTPKNKPKRLLKQDLTRRGYPSVVLCVDSKPRRYSVHRLVLLAFVGQPQSGKTDAAHLDGNRHNNRLENLVWATKSENEQHKKRHGTYLPRGGNKTWPYNKRAKLNPEIIDDFLTEYRKGNTSIRGLARKYGVSHMTLLGVLNRKTWRWLTGEVQTQRPVMDPSKKRR